LWAIWESMKNFFLSVKTTVWMLIILICLFFIGSYMMPLHREIFTSMNDAILIRWLKHDALSNIRYTWWFFAALAGLVLLTANTIICSIQAIKERWVRSDFLIRIAPQIIHVGVLFILLAHLIDAGWGYRISGVMPEGAYAPLPDDMAIHLDRVYVVTDKHGNIVDWRAEASMYENNEIVTTGMLGPNNPLFARGVGVYLRNLDFDRGRVAYLTISKEPGVITALVGAILFMIGAATLLVLKWKMA